MKDLQQKINKIADEKLDDFLDSRFGGLFEMVGGHGEKSADYSDIEAINQCIENMHSCLRKDPNGFPWHGTVFKLARLVTKAMLINKFREKESSEFIKKVNEINNITNYE